MRSFVGWSLICPLHPPAKLEVLHLFRWFTHTHIYIYIYYCIYHMTLCLQVAWHSQSVALHSYIHCLALLLNWLDYIALSSHCTALRWSTCSTSTSYCTIYQNYLKLHYISLYYIILCYITLQYFTFQHIIYQVALHCITPNYTTEDVLPESRG